MRIEFLCVPPGGGETNYRMVEELSAVPHDGAHIMFPDQSGEGTRDFIVRLTSWIFEPNGAKALICRKPCVEIEFALSPFSSESHTKWCEIYYKRTGIPCVFVDTTY